MRRSAGSAGTAKEDGTGTGTGCAEGPAVGRMRGLFCLEGVGYTPGAEVRN